MKDLFYFFSVAVLLGSPLFFGIYVLERAACHAKWGDAVNRYGVLEGCMIEWEGKVVPSDRVWVGDK